MVLGIIATAYEWHYFGETWQEGSSRVGGRDKDIQGRGWQNNSSSSLGKCNLVRDQDPYVIGDIGSLTEVEVED